MVIENSFQFRLVSPSVALRTCVELVRETPFIFLLHPRPWIPADVPWDLRRFRKLWLIQTARETLFEFVFIYIGRIGNLKRTRHSKSRRNWGEPSREIYEPGECNNSGVCDVAREVEGWRWRRKIVGGGKHRAGGIQRASWVREQSGFFPLPFPPREGWKCPILARTCQRLDNARIREHPRLSIGCLIS